jgi:hypothetical protein
MLAASTTSRAIILVLAICSIGVRPTYAQNASSLNPSKTMGSRMSSGAWPAKCSGLSKRSLAGIWPGEGEGWPPIPSGTTADATLVRYPDALCVEPAPSFTRRAPVLADYPCPADAGGSPGAPRTSTCGASPDTVLAELSALGKAGVKIARAREEVLDIMRSNNACTEWFETKEATPAATFQSLSFLLDEHGPRDVFETRRPDALILWRQPYVASATQDGGAHTAITINVYGAFYRTQGQVLEVGPEAGPERLGGTRLLTVGKYAGGTRPAQVITLLHEFGHIVDLLPEDADNLDGKSVRNTDEVQRHCRSEVEARAKQPRAPGAR